MSLIEPLLTEAQLADALGATRDQVGVWRRQYGWPHVKLGREVRFTAAQVDEIVALHTVRPANTTQPVGLPGQTPRSAARNARRGL